MKRTLQVVVQALFLVLFTILIITGRMQLWMLIFVACLILGFFFGRFYCGWICPIHTVTRAVGGIKKKLGIGSLKTPGFLKSEWAKYILIVLFAASFAFVMITGKRLPVLLFLLAVGVAVSALFSESLWHSSLCPYGLILRLPGSKSGRFMRIRGDRCIRCGLCVKTCPGGAISGEEPYSIDKSLCMLCNECVRVCPADAIKYESKSGG